MRFRTLNDLAILNRKSLFTVRHPWRDFQIQSHSDHGRLVAQSSQFKKMAQFIGGNKNNTNEPITRA